MKIRKIAVSDSQVKSIEKDVKDVKKDIRDLKKDLKDAEKKLDSLNIGQRRFWQQSTVWTSLQRKIERMEKVEQEWKKYKNEMDSKVKKLVEQKTRAQVQSSSNSWYRSAKEEDESFSFVGAFGSNGISTVEYVIDGKHWRYTVTSDVAQDLEDMYRAILKSGGSKCDAARVAYGKYIPARKKDEVQLDSYGKQISETHKEF